MSCAPALQDSATLRTYVQTRARTEALAAQLSAEDQQLQSMADASPAKWHRAHTTWFFETFVLAAAGIPRVDARYDYLFNSYYDAVGPRHERARRGMLSRPTASEVGDYRRVVDERMTRWFATSSAEARARLLPVVELGIAHEEQHQELLLTDILHAFSQSPLRPAFVERGAEVRSAGRSPVDAARFVTFEGGLRRVGAPWGGTAFAFDNERPDHRQWIEPFQLADRLVTFGELREFVRSGGYRTPSLWLAEGYDFVRANDIESPLHCALDDGEILVFSLIGERRPPPDEPLAHVSYYEADAIARFLGARLPTEGEWEVAAAEAAVAGNFVDDGVLHPSPAPADRNRPRIQQLFGDVWEWTRSSYEAYPGYRPPAGALGEYNGKFMVGQRVLRGGSCLTPRRHVRPTYRNFWPPATRFQMTGLRLARDVRDAGP